MSDLVRFDDLKRGIGSIARLARSDPQKALMGRVLYFIEHLEKKNGWISVKDRLPEPDKYVLLFVEAEYGNYQAMAWLIKGGDNDKCVWDSNDEEFLKGSGTITHWMPLPEPPKEVDGNA